MKSVSQSVGAAAGFIFNTVVLWSMLWLYKAHRRQVGASAGQTTMPKNAAAAVAAPAQTLLLSAGNEPRESEILANDAGGLFFCFIYRIS